VFHFWSHSTLNRYHYRVLKSYPLSQLVSVFASAVSEVSVNSFKSVSSKFGRGVRSWNQKFSKSVSSGADRFHDKVSEFWGLGFVNSGLRVCEIRGLGSARSGV